jgi:hypothetical protein
MLLYQGRRHVVVQDQAPRPDRAEVRVPACLEPLDTFPSC